MEQIYEVKVDDEGTTRWYQNGQYHRLDGPAVEYADGDKYWYQNGQYHRLDGPAVEYADGDKYWYQNGQCHRLNGPAVECANGDKEWWINGEKLTEKEFSQQSKPCLGKKVTVDGVEYTLS